MPVSPVSTLSPAQSQFVALLREMFQIQNLDLDFGIYRVLNQERRLIDKFLDERLGPLTREALGAADDTVRTAKSDELDQKIAARRADGDSDEDIENSTAIKKLRAELAALPDTGGLETEVYNALCDFFGRYYDAGDFLSRPRYRRDVYALPYNGEEVKLHWANRDQYYIKSAQVLESFEWNCDGQKVRFQLREAGTASDNNKEERRFVLALDENEKPVVHRDEDVLVVEFDFKKVSGGPRDLNADADRRLREWAGGADLVAPLLTPFNGNTEKSQFLHRLNGWAARGSFDFFVHKDLRGFLARELDFYLKNEVVQLDTLLSSDGGTWEKTTLAKARAIHALGSRIIEFLSSLEDLQKRLWEKQKWVTQSRAIVPFALVPAALQADVLANADQIAEWKALYGVENEATSTVNPVAWSEPPAPEWAAQHGDIAVDTKHFDPAWTRRLWSELSKEHTLDELWNGVLWNADNFAALNLMQRRFKEAVKCIYIDPPYNTDAIPIIYKNNYKDSSWLSLIQSRLLASLSLLKDVGAISIAIDDFELVKLCAMLETEFSNFDLFKCIVNHYPGSGTGRSNVSRTHEYNLYLVPKDEDILRGSEREEGMRERGFRRSGTGENNFRYGRENSFFAVLVDPTTFAIKGLEPPPPLATTDYIREDTIEGWKRIYPFGEDGSERVWSLSYEGALDALEAGLLESSDKFVIKRLYQDEKARSLLQSVWLANKFNATSHGTNLLTAMFGESGKFSYPKSLFTPQTAIDAATFDDKSSLVLDYFAGSGTTGHAVINLNRADGEKGHRRFILVEMGRYFDTVLVPRLKKAAFSKNWNEGRPADFAARNGVPQSLFVYRLESYEDALEHLAAVVETNGQPALQAPDDDWTVRYAISSSTGAGELPLSDALFAAPFAMQMRVGGNDAGEAQMVTLDAVATFNWLLGLRVHKMWFPTDKLGAVCGLTPDNRAVLVVWRQLKDETFEDADAALLAFWQNDPILAAWRADHDVKTVYLNGDSTQWRTQTRHESWTCEPLEDTFRSLMFATSPRREGF